MHRTVPFLVLVGACASGDDDMPSFPACDEIDASAAAMEIGTGERAFEPFGAVTSYHLGPQGGWHIYGSLRATGVWAGNPGTLDESTPLLSFTLEAKDGSFDGGYRDLRIPLDDLGDGTVERVGELVILAILEPEVAEGAAVRVEAELVDACGTRVQDAAETTLTSGG